MSYSRWGNSRWYCYMNPQLQFVVERVAVFSFYEVKYERERCLNKLRESERHLAESDVIEVSNYMDQYLIDALEERMQTHSE